MSSIGENRLLVNSRIVGRIRVLNVQPGLALFPRLTFRLAVFLHDSPTNFFEPDRPIRAFELHDLQGELRLKENEKTLALIHWVGRRRHVPSTSHDTEAQIEAVCDLDRLRFEILENHRAGKEAIFWLVLWPTLIDAKGFLDCEIDPIRIVVPRDDWLRLISSLTPSFREVLEINRPSLESPEFDAAMGHILDARSRVDRGDFDEAVAACRRALESIANALDVPRKPGALRQVIAAVTDEKRAEAYSGIVARLKELGNFTIHRPEAPGRYTRSEAKFVVGATEHSLALLAALLHLPQRIFSE